MVVIGSCVGAGIFFTPAQIAAYLEQPNLILVVWGLGGIMALSGALTYAELGAMFPKAGGIYHFLKGAFGPLVAFLYGWVSLLVIVSGSIAALSLVFANYLAVVVPIGENGKTVVAIGAIAFVTLINVFGAKNGERFSIIFTISKLLGIGFIVVVGLAFGSWALNDFSQWVPAQQAESPGIAGAIGLALVGVCFSFGGFQHASYLAGESRRPQRDVPWGMVIGVLIVTVVYLGANLAYLRLLPVIEIANSSAVAADAIGPLFGWGGTLVAVIIAISTFGTVGVYTLTAPRVYYAMANDGLFFPFLSRIHPKTGSPLVAILTQSTWAILLVLLWGHLAEIIHYVVFADWVFLILAAISIYIFRAKHPEMERPYKTIGYPWVPLVFIAISVFIIGNTLVHEPMSAVMALVCLAIGVPVFLVFRHRLRSK